MTISWLEPIALIVLIGMLVRARRRGNALKRRTFALETLAEMSEVLQLSSSQEEVTELLPQFGKRLFPAYDGSVYIVRSSPGTLELAAWWQGEKSGGRFLTFPMLAAGESMGVVTLSGSVSHIDRRLAEHFTNQIGLTLGSLRLLDALRTRAVRDPLTGLFNRRYMEETLLREMLRGARAHVPIGIIIADVDHFKRFNDTYGHAGGDALLRQLARVMERVFRDSDVVCRYGGEEFVIVVPDIGLDELRNRAERLRQEVKQTQVRLDGKVLGPVTISSGLAVAPDYGSTVDALFASADRALYAAKSGGRDRVAIPLPEVIGRDAA
ncbi:MAG TPA: diguanylate cyclase [Thermoanaerobaculia bacterium]|nr:diguanylate cyclase [Thermoanaerobaculia bacterium]